MFKRRLNAAAALLLAGSLITGVVPTSAYAAAPTNGQLLPYFKSSLGVEARVADLLGRMTLDEKIGQMVQAERASVTPEDVMNYNLGSVLSGGGSFPNGKQADSTQANWAKLVDAYQAGALSTRLGIPILYGVDAIHGNSNLIGTTLFPHNIALGATRDPALVKQIGSATAQEIKAAGTNWAFAPTIADPQNIQWGRTYEGFSDNQQLVAQMGAAFIEGLQGNPIDALKNSDKVVATAKHFLGEGLTDNGTNQGNVSGMTEAEVIALDLPMYKAAIDAGARTVMASYSSIQGLKMHANQRLLTDLLKGTGEGQLGFTGFVVSDYNGADQITKDWNGNAVGTFKDRIGVAVNAGVDMLMEPSNWKNTITSLKELVKEGKVTQARIDDAVTRILRVKFESGVFEHPMTDTSLAATFGSDAHRALARQAVAESLVLLKNDEVGGTPILSQLKGMGKIFVAGKSADNIGLQAGGWSISWQGQAGNITPGTTILKGIKDAVGATKTVTYNKHGLGAKGNDVAIAVIGETPYAESNGDSLNSLKLDTEDQATLDNLKASGVPTIVVLVSGRPLIVNDRLQDWAGLVEAWLPGTEGEGVADVLFGNTDFSGKLPVRWPFYTEAYQTPAAGQSNLEAKYVLFDYGYGLRKTETTPTLPVTPDKPGQARYEKVEAENYIAKSDGLKAETASDVGGGQDMGYTGKDAWMTYMIDVPQAGAYDVDFRYAGGDASITSTGMQMLDAAGHVLGELKVGSTGGWQSWQTATVSGVTLQQGVQQVKMVFTNGGINFNWFASVGFKPAAVPGNGNGGTVTPQPVVKSDAVENWISGERATQSMTWYYAPQWQDGDKQLEQQPNLDLTAIGNDSDVTTIKINPNKTYQTVTGMGSSMEESTVFNLSKMSDAKQTELITKLVSPDEGIGMSMTRVTIGTPDFTARSFYTYDDMEPGQTDPDLTNFSIQKDIDYHIISTLQKIKAMNPNMKFFASPWSPPGWMKTTDSMIKGQVKDEYLPVLANYYVKFIQAYKEQGIEISAMTLQNEPLLEIEYPSTKMSWQQEAELAKLLKAKLREANLDVKIWVFDHNFSDAMSYAAPMLADPANREAIDGTAFHDYAGDPSTMTQLHDMYPDKNIYLTERAVWGTAGADRIAQYFRNWAKSYNSWVVMLDSDISTHQWVGTPDPTMVIQDSGNPDNYWLTPEYYMLGNFSKFIQPDDIRIDSNYGDSNKVTNVAFMSPDKSQIVTVVINHTDTPQTFKLVSDGTQMAATLPAKSVGTYRWDRIVTTPVEPVQLQVTPQTLAYNVDQQTITLDLTGGTFNASNLGEIKLGQTASALGITIGEIALISPQQLALKLHWDADKVYYANTPLQVTVPVTAYADSTDGDPLVGSVWLTGTSHQTAAVEITNPVTANDYDQLSGAAIEAADTDHAQITGIGAGDWTDFKIKVPTAGKYTVTLQVASPNGSSFLLQTGEGNTLSSFVIPNQYGSNSWIGARTAVELPAGEQTFRVYGNAGEFSLKAMVFEPVAALKAGTDGTIKAEAESFVQAGQQVIQYGDTFNNLGYTVSGSTFDYLLDIPQAGYYKVRLRYATPQSGVSAAVFANGQSRGSTALPSTGGWGTYTEAYAIVLLDAGIQILRIVDNGDGFNLDWLQLEPSEPPVAAKGQAASPFVSKVDTASSGARLVTLATATTDAAIHYTTDGSLPSADSPVSDGAITVTSSRVIRAIAIQAGMTNSFVAFYAAPDAIVPVTKVSLDPSALTLHPGDTAQLTAAVAPEEASNPEVTWTSSDTLIATVDATGKVTGVSEGNATLTVTTADGAKTAQTHVAVVANSVPTPTPTSTPTPTPSPTSAPVQPPVSGDNRILEVQPVLDANGTATATLLASDIERAVTLASDGTIYVHVKPIAGMKQVKLIVPLQRIAASPAIQRLNVDTGLATVSLNSSILQNKGSTAENAQLTVTTVDISTLSSEVQAQLNGSSVLDFSLSIDGNPIHPLKDSDVRFGIPYTLHAGEKPTHVVIYAVDDSGQLKVVKNGQYDASTGLVVFKAGQFSRYTAAYANSHFKDTDHVAWAEDSIEALAARGAIQGTGAGQFNPNGDVTRAEFIQMLMNTFDLSDSSAASTFTDVKAGAWYTNAVASAQQLGVVMGKPDGTFGLNDKISRQEMAVMIFRMSQQLQMKLSSNGGAAVFTDQAQLAAYAQAAVAAIHDAGLINGLSDGSFSPNGKATRAQAAVIIFRLFDQ